MNVIKPKQILELINTTFNVDLSCNSRERDFADLRKIYYYYSYKYCLLSTQSNIASEINKNRSNIPVLLNSFIELTKYDERVRNMFNVFGVVLNNKYDLSYLNDEYTRLEDFTTLRLKRTNIDTHQKLKNEREKVRLRKNIVKELKEEIHELKNNNS